MIEGYEELKKDFSLLGFVKFGLILISFLNMIFGPNNKTKIKVLI